MVQLKQKSLCAWVTLKGELNPENNMA